MEVMRLHYKESDVQVIIVNTYGYTHDWFTVEVWCRCPKDTFPERRNHRKQWLRSDMIGDPEFLNGSTNIVRMFKEMLGTGKPPVAYEVPLELMAIVDAAKMAQGEHRRVYLEESCSKQKEV